jgi:hypothetical protein
MRFNKSIVGVLAMLPLLGLLLGCSGVLPETLEEKLASNPTANDHLAAAKLYQNKERELEAEAAKYQAAVSKIGPYDDPKGFRRAALKMAAQEKRYEANQMEQQYAAHLGEAQSRSLHGKLPPQ